MNITKSRMAVVAAGALVITAIAGTGGAVAGALITSADIQDKTIQKWDLAPGSVTSGKIVDGTIGLQDISSTTKAALKGDPGASGVMAYTDTETADGSGEAVFENALSCPSGTNLLAQATDGGDGDSLVVTAWSDDTRPATVSVGTFIKWNDATAGKGVDDVTVTGAGDGAKVTIKIVCG